MLTELRIKDFAIIDDLALDLGPGFIVFTGETGAGKSIIIDAVEMILGGRAEAVNIRTGSEQALIEGTFQIDTKVEKELDAILVREELQEEHGFLNLSREIRREGRNICRVNGRVVPLAVLREIGQWLVDVHGQSEHLSLLRVPEHINLLDRFAQIGDELDDYSQEYQALHHLRRELDGLRQSEQDSAQRAELLAYQVAEIESANLQAGEGEILTEERNRLVNAEHLAERAQQALLALDDESNEGTSIVDLLGKVLAELTGLAKVDPSSRSSIEELHRTDRILSGSVE
jgi:DNA repair protein RecN (Recombination protein N)